MYSGWLGGNFPKNLIDIESIFGEKSEFGLSYVVMKTGKGKGTLIERVQIKKRARI